MGKEDTKWQQITMGICLILGLFTRMPAAVAIMMGLMTILVPGLIIMQDVPHFAYAFAFTGGALVMFLESSGPYSIDDWLRYLRTNRMTDNAVNADPIE